MNCKQNQTKKQEVNVLCHQRRLTAYDDDYNISRDPLCKAQGKSLYFMCESNLHWRSTQAGSVCVVPWEKLGNIFLQTLYPVFSIFSNITPLADGGGVFRLGSGLMLQATYFALFCTRRPFPSNFKAPDEKENGEEAHKKTSERTRVAEYKTEPNCSSGGQGAWGVRFVSFSLPLQFL